MRRREGPKSMSAASSSPRPKLKYQALGDLYKLRRSAMHSHFRRKVDDLADDTNFPTLKAFLPQNLWAWARSYLKYAFGRKHKFQTYPANGERGVYPLQAADGGQVFRLSIAGDWGTGTREAAEVAAGMLASNPDYTLHLGDVYFVGDTTEISENCLGKTEFGYQGVVWPKGKIGSFSMNGNHEMYANGNAYFDLLLPALGIPSSQDKKQLASFFCLENATWRILALDTGYNSIGLPILGQIPLINKIPGIGASNKLPAASLEWIRDVVRPQERPRVTILLTHHQSFSAFEASYTRPAEQLQEFFGGQEIIWLWGHEHRWAVYDKHSQSGITAYARCIGHGGMPVEMATPNGNAPLQFFDERVYQQDECTKFGMNGFVNLKIAGNKVTLDHRDVTNKSILMETFTAVAPGKITQIFDYVDPQLSRRAQLTQAMKA
jgi:hypothetical protein